MRDVIGIFNSKARYIRNCSCTAYITVIFRIRLKVRIWVRVLGSSDHCILKFNSVLLYRY